jgi:imidazole glycerol-phosphate synthase subunit HisH
MIVIVDFKMGNLGSIANIIKKIGYDSIISSDVETIKKATKIILPGVGAFDKAMGNLKSMELIDVLNEKVLTEKTPILGICLGMQLLTRKSEEGNVSGLEWIEADTIKFRFDENRRDLKIPHMGWNEITISHKHPLFDDMYENSRFYFVHSYHAVCDNKDSLLTQTFYGYEFASCIIKNNIMGVQFHPEKSHKFGMKLIKNFIEKC